METEEFDREQQWIAKYRAALDTCPNQQRSLFQHFVIGWQHLSERLATGSVDRFHERMQTVSNRSQVDKRWMASLSLRRLRRQT
jgi:hypothetical protein